MKRQISVFILVAALCSTAGCGGAFTDLSNSFDKKDIVPPGQVRITAITEGASQISFTWTDPGNSDFDHVVIACSGVTGSSEIPKGTESYVQNGLTPGSDYTFDLRTVDLAGNISKAVTFTVNTSDNGNISIIYTADDLNSVRDNPAANYAIMTDIDLNGYDGGDGNGWMPIGNSTTSFNGTFNGNGHTVRNMSINRTTDDNQGLFGYLGSGARIRDLRLNAVNVSGRSSIGALAGYNDGGTVTGCHAAGEVDGSSGMNSVAGGLVGANHSSGLIQSCSAAVAVKGYYNSGGLVGLNNSGTISNCYASGQVEGSYYYTGGLAGNNNNGGSITGCHAVGNVYGEGDTGGLVGFNQDSGSKISNCYATGAVEGSGQNTGGLVGLNADHAAIEYCYATGSVEGSDMHTGGLVGYLYQYSAISNCYVRGSVLCSDVYAGGIVGCSDNTGTIENCYATGEITGPSSYVGGIVGHFGDTVTGCFYDRVTTGYNDRGTVIWSDRGTPASTSEMTTQGTFTGWDFVATPVWAIDSDINGGYPYLVDNPPVE